MVLIRQAETPRELDDVRELMREYMAWVVASERSLDAPTFAGFDEELASLPGEFGPPAGRLLLATVDDHPAGCVALRRHGDAEAELKRMYVRPGHRGQRIGTRLVEQLIAEARTIGYRRIVLDSHRSMTSAHAIYRAAGFRDVPVPDSFPDHLKPEVVFMQLDLAGPRPSR